MQSRLVSSSRAVSQTAVSNAFCGNKHKETVMAAAAGGGGGGVL